MESIFEAAGGKQAFIDLANWWHARCLADPVVSHAFSHGYHPQHVERLAAYWAEALGGPREFTGSVWSSNIRAWASTPRWTSGPKSVSSKPWMMPDSRTIPACVKP
jgi:truncated hemoglobin YjbI